MINVFIGLVICGYSLYLIIKRSKHTGKLRKMDSWFRVQDVWNVLWDNLVERGKQKYDRFIFDRVDSDDLDFFDSSLDTCF